MKETLPQPGVIFACLRQFYSNNKVAMGRQLIMGFMLASKRFQPAFYFTGMKKSGQ